MSNYTPGKWQLDADCGHEAVIDEKGLLIADCAIFSTKHNITRERCRANARVIVLVPDMVAFIKGLQSRPGHYGGCTNQSIPCIETCIEANRILMEVGVEA